MESDSLEPKRKAGRFGRLLCFMFISAITDRDAHFNQEDVPRASAQNFSCAFNGGIFLSWFLPFLEANRALLG